MSGKVSNRSGVALIIVLGLVAILMIISVAFAIHMRVERAGAANLRHAAVARQIVKGAMAAAIAAVDKDVGDEIVAPWYDEDDVENLVYKRTERWYKDGIMEERTTNFWKGTFVSYDVNASEHVVAHFPSEVDDYLPYGLKYRSFANKYLAAGANSGATPIIQPEWRPVYSDTGNSSVIGRYSYFVLDTTGMLDANAGYGTASNGRGMGRETKEIKLVSSVASIPRNRNGAYVNIAELEKVNPVLKGFSNIWWNTFSYEPTNDLVYIGGDVNDIKNRKWAIIDAFYDLGLTYSSEDFIKPSGHEKASEQACWAYLGLVDYVDDDYKMEEDLGIRPTERPVTERMPLVSGFFAKLTITARHVQTKAGDDAPWDTSRPVEVKASADVKVPFVFPFGSSFDSKDGQSLKLEGKAAVQISAKGGGKDSRKETASISPSDPVDCIVETIKVNNGNDDGWVNVRGRNDTWTIAEQLRLSRVKAYLQVGGATFRGNDIQHSFPVDADNYRGFDPDMGMVVGFVPETEGMSFNENNPSRTENTEDQNTHVKTQTRFWETNVLVWAEIVDPRYANASMAAVALDPNDHLTRACYKPSHFTSSSNSRQLYTLREIKGRLPSFAGFDQAASFEKDFLDPSKTKNAFGEEGADSPFGKYFDGSYFSTREGAGPFASYLLTHPEAAEDLYGMPMDGIKKDSSADETDSAWAKWRMFVKNGRLDSVGELGYLPIGFWQTIRLYDYGDNFGKVLQGRGVPNFSEFNALPEDPQVRLYQELHDNGADDHGSDDNDKYYFHDVLDSFTVVKSSRRANEIVKGRINLNASPRDLLASVFMDMSIKEPDNLLTGSAKITETNAYLLAASIIESRNNLGNFCFLSELGYLFDEPVRDTRRRPHLWSKYRGNSGGGERLKYPVQAVWETAKNSPWGEFEREAIIRNSCGLFTTRGQSFLIIVRGESYSPRFGRKTSMLGGNSNASKTAIAQIWRDTLPDANGKHPIFVKFFKIVDD